MMDIRLSMALLVMTAGIGMVGCDGGSSTPMPTPMPDEPAPPPPPAATSFTAFVTDQFDATADDTDPVPVDDTDFAFDDQDNADAFSGILEDS